jgi:signal transduction histidine kinase
VELVVATERTVLADRSRLRQLFENLFRNAVEHGSTSSRTPSDEVVEHAGPNLTVTVGDCDGGFYIADDGRGVPAELRDGLFEPGSSGEGGGLGLGLSIVSRVAQAHGWEVAVTESESGGARFEVTGVEEE